MELYPHLALVPVAKIRFHEQPEQARTLRLVERLRQEAMLRHPPVVAETGEAAYLLLDGANRVSALQALRYSHAPVQVVDYADAQVLLKGWHHLLPKGVDSLRESYVQLPGLRLEPVQRKHLPTLLELRRVFAVLVENGRCWGLFSANDADIPLEERINTLRQVVAAYEGKGRLERVKVPEYTHLPQVVQRTPHRLVLVPAFHKEELLHLAQRGIMIPTGLTRHLIPGRALGMNLNLEFLSRLDNEAAKQKHFREWLDAQMMRGSIRLYEEPIFFMNE